MSINHWPASERPREKLLLQGADTLSDAELLAIFLRSGVKGKTAVDLARDLITHFGNLRLLLEANKQHICQIRGLGSAKYVQLQATLEIGRRYLQQTLPRHDPLSNPKDTYRYLTAQLRGYQHEVFACLFLDAKLRIICYEELFHGTINNATVYPREVIKRALSHNACAIIFAHNHPSGIAEPSAVDKQITLSLKEALQLVDIRVIDHIIVGDGHIVSLAERGIV